MVKKKTKKQTTKKKKPTKSQLEEWIHMASSGRGATFAHGTKMLGGFGMMAGGPGTHAIHPAM